MCTFALRCGTLTLLPVALVACGTAHCQSKAVTAKERLDAAVRQNDVTKTDCPPVEEVPGLDVFRVGKIDLILGKGAEGITEDMIARLMTQRTGAPFSRTAYFCDLNRILSLYRSRGHVRADVDAENSVVEFLPNAPTVDFVFRISPGPLFRCGQVDLVGADPRHEQEILREIPFGQNDVFDSTALVDARERILQLGYVADVTIATDYAAEPDVINMTINVVEKSPLP